MSKLWSFFKSHQAGSFMAPLGTSPSHDDDDSDDYETNLDDDSHK